MKKIFSLSLFVLLTGICAAQQPASTFVTYKQLDTLALKMEVIGPAKLEKNKVYPAIVYFYGGGWSRGSTASFKRYAEYFASKGFVNFLVDYRVKSRQGTTPFESLKDAKSAMRFVRKNVAQFHIDPNTIIAAGGSAGGQLAAACALVEKNNEASDDLSVSPKPNALVLFNPVIDNGPGGYGYERVKDDYLNFSPMHNIKKGTPPTLIMIGDKDHLIPAATIQKYKAEMEKVGSRCDLVFYPGQEHGFYNKKEFFEPTKTEMEKFLGSLPFLTLTN
ncbi:MAG: peptidase [Sphingobacteriaceae bacterium]|jgi:acetyl esterase/lipase|nr:peptidase [Sphingobacteriaceae bacterium]